MRINVFNGGIHTRPAPHLIQTNESREFINVDNSKGILAPIKAPLVTAIAGAKKYAFFSDAEDEWQFSDTPVDWLDFQERLYFSDRTSTPKRVIGGVESDLGIAIPDGSSATVSAVYPKPPPDKDDVVTGTTTVMGGTFSFGTPAIYRIARVTAGGLVSLSSRIVTIFASVNNNALTVKMPSDEGIAGANWILLRKSPDGMYRRAGYTDTSDTEKRTIIDAFFENLGSEANLGLTGTYQYAITYYDSATGIESGPYIFDEITISGAAITIDNIPVSSDTTVDKKRIYRIGGDTSVFTMVDEINNATTSFSDARREYELDGRLLRTANHLPPKAGLQYLTESYAMLFGALGDKVYYTPIGIPEAWPELYFLDFPAEVTAIVPTANGIVICTKYKSYLVTGTGPSSFSIQLLSSDQGCISHDSVALIAGTGLWVSKEGICASDGSSVQVVTKVKLGMQSFDPVMSAIYDEEYHLQLTDGTVFIVDFSDSILRKENHSLQSIVASNNKLYGFNGTALLQCYAGSDDLEYEFESGWYVGELYTRPKAYKSVYVALKGVVEVSVFVDGELAATKMLVASKTMIKEVKIEEKYKKGTAINYTVKGTGTVYEVFLDEDSANG